MNRREFLKRKIFLKTQSIEIAQAELAELQRELGELEKSREGDSDGE